MSQVVAVELVMPDDLARFRLPAALDARLQRLLDRQDRGQILSTEEREEAEGLVDLAELLTLLRLRRTGREPAMSEISGRLRRLVVKRAKGRCEYCGLSQEGQEATFHIDHIVPRVSGGPTTLDNLALACVSCSLRKESRRSARDPKREFGNLSGLENFAEIVTIAGRRHSNFNQGRVNDGKSYGPEALRHRLIRCRVGDHRATHP